MIKIKSKNILLIAFIFEIEVYCIENVEKTFFT